MEKPVRSISQEAQALLDYLDAVRDRIIPVLQDRPLSVIRVHRGQEAFMQKNVPKYTPDWVRSGTSLIMITATRPTTSRLQSIAV